MTEMEQVLENFPEQFVKSIDFTDIKINKKFSNIIVNGMGGSALPANLFRIYLHDLYYQKKMDYLLIYNNRTYTLPPEADENSLIISISYSGNTEETLSSHKEALSRGLNTIGIASGGQLEKICQEMNTSFVKIQNGIQPRMASGYFMGVLIKIFADSGVIPFEEANSLIGLTSALKTINPSLKNEAKLLSPKLKDRVPIIYSSTRWKTMAMIWKINFNENTKIQAFNNYFPELNHNEMVGFTKILADYFILILRDLDEKNSRTHQRMDLFKDMMTERNIPVETVDFEHGSRLFKIFSSQLLSFWLSYFLALDYGIDPIPVEMVEDFKRRLPPINE